MGRGSTSSAYALRHLRVVLEDRIIEDGYVVVEEGRIAEVGREPLEGFKGESERLDGLTALPGFIDTHIHGVEGIDLTSQLEPETALEMGKRLARYGVTSFAPSSVSAPRETLLTMCRAIRKAKEVWEPSQGARILGLHLEGPYINKKMAGAHKVEYIRSPSIQEFKELIEASGNSVVQVTIAPEIEGGTEFIGYAKRLGVIVSAGHTDATYEEGIEAIRAGVTKATHLFNAMRRFHHRDPGIALALIENPSVYLEVIADYIHLHPAVLRFIARYAGPDRVVLVSDAIAATGLGDGEYVLGGIRVRVEGGVARIAGADTLAGSTLTMDRAFVNMVKLGFRLQDVARMASTTPAKSLNLDPKLRIGKIEKGYLADIVIVDEEYQIRRTYIEGEKVYEK